MMMKELDDVAIRRSVDGWWLSLWRNVASSVVQLYGYDNYNYRYNNMWLSYLDCSNIAAVTAAAAAAHVPAMIGAYRRRCCTKIRSWVRSIYDVYTFIALPVEKVMERNCCRDFFEWR